MAKIQDRRVQPQSKFLYFVSREESYEDIKNAVRCSRVHLAMAVLSTIVAIVGLRHNSVTVSLSSALLVGSIGITLLLRKG